MKNEALRKLMKERQVFLDERDKYYDKFTEEELGSDDFEDLAENPKCEALRLQILKLIEDYHKELTVESIFEGLTSIGAAPSLIYDDDGNFAIGGDGIQNVIALESEGKDDKDDLDFQGIWYFKKENWKPTVREAIEDYINRYR